VQRRRESCGSRLLLLQISQAAEERNAQVAHVWTIRDGRAVKFQQYLDTLQVARDAERSKAPCTFRRRPNQAMKPAAGRRDAQIVISRPKASNCRFQFTKRGQLLIRPHNETFPLSSASCRYKTTASFRTAVSTDRHDGNIWSGKSGMNK